MIAAVALDDLQHLLAGLDVLDGIVLDDTTAHGQLAQHLVRQGMAQGVAITEREAQLVAKLVLAPVPTAMNQDDSPLSLDQVRAFFRWPILERTPAEREARWRRLCDPRRWGRSVLKALGFASLSMVALEITHKVGEWNLHTHFFQQSSLHENIGMVATGGLVAALLLGVLGTVIALCEAFWPMDAAIYHDRRDAVYRAQLDRLTALQLAQVLTGLRAEACRERANLDVKLLHLAEAAMAARQPGA